MAKRVVKYDKLRELRDSLPDNLTSGMLYRSPSYWSSEQDYVYCAVGFALHTNGVPNSAMGRVEVHIWDKDMPSALHKHRPRGKNARYNTSNVLSTKLLASIYGITLGQARSIMQANDRSNEDVRKANVVRAIEVILSSEVLEND